MAKAAQHEFLPTMRGPAIQEENVPASLHFTATIQSSHSKTEALRGSTGSFPQDERFQQAQAFEMGLGWEEMTLISGVHVKR